MELPWLRSFLHVASSGSASRAAGALSISQPAVTQHIRALESELGVRLFDRTGRGLSLTAAGLLLQKHVQQAHSLLEEGRQAVADLEAGTAGTLLVGAGVTASIFYLPGKLRAFKRKYPGVDVVVRTGSSLEITKLTLERQLDFGLVTSAARQRELRSVELFREQIILVCQARDALGRTPVRLRQLPGVPLILFARPSGFRDYLDGAMAGAGVGLTVKMESDSVEAIKSFVAVGLGASYLPRSAVEAELDAGILRQVHVIGAPRLERATTLIYRRDRYMAAPQRDFLAEVRP